MKNKTNTIKILKDVQSLLTQTISKKLLTQINDKVIVTNKSLAKRKAFKQFDTIMDDAQNNIIEGE